MQQDTLIADLRTGLVAFGLLDTLFFVGLLRVNIKEKRKKMRLKCVQNTKVLLAS